MKFLNNIKAQDRYTLVMYKKLYPDNVRLFNNMKHDLSYFNLSLSYLKLRLRVSTSHHNKAS